MERFEDSSFEESDFGWLVALSLMFFALADLLILACVAFDTLRNRRLHPAFMAGFAVVVVGQIGRLAFSQTAAWMSFAKWLVA